MLSQMRKKSHEIDRSREDKQDLQGSLDRTVDKLEETVEAVRGDLEIKDDEISTLVEIVRTIEDSRGTKRSSSGNNRSSF
ncbi:unnamed protein product [Ilex paraguariensis]|uniref:Uncharacterized protein n=1 Tax=Ilex paraguariensis TaxID=185542 RepID=A0ABC8RN33_9AQUA